MGNETRKAATLDTPSGLSPEAIRDIPPALTALLADVFALAELREDNRQLAASMRQLHGLSDEQGDVATTSLLEVWIDEAERRTWFLFEATRDAE